MKKFVISISTFILGVFGVLLCLMNITIVDNIYTRTGSTDSISTYTYTTDSIMIFGLVVFGFIAITGLLFSIKFANQKDM